MKNIRFCFLSMLVLVWITEGLRCPSCTYLTLDTNLPIIGTKIDKVRAVVDKLLKAYQKPECAQDLKGPIPEIQEETCQGHLGEVSRCSFYKGVISVKIRIPVFPDTYVNLHIYERGCYHSVPTNVPSDGCHDRENIDEDKEVIQHIIDAANFVLTRLDVAEFSGERCLCTDTYCRVSSGVRDTNSRESSGVRDPYSRESSGVRDPYSRESSGGRDTNSKESSGVSDTSTSESSGVSQGAKLNITLFSLHFFYMFL